MSERRSLWGRFPEKLLRPAEEIVVHVRPHPIAYLRPLLSATIIVSGGALCLGMANVLEQHISALLIQGAVSILMVLLGCAVVIVPFIHKVTSQLVITTQRIIYKRGLCRCRMKSVAISSVHAAEVRQGVHGKLWGFGTLYLASAEKGSLAFEHLPRPRAIEREVKDLIVQHHDFT